jgi:hypothetical protein
VPWIPIVDFVDPDLIVVAGRMRAAGEAVHQCKSTKACARITA